MHYSTPVPDEHLDAPNSDNVQNQNTSQCSIVEVNSHGASYRLERVCSGNHSSWSEIKPPKPVVPPWLLAASALLECARRPEGRAQGFS